MQTKSFAVGKLSVSMMCADLIDLRNQISQIEQVGVDYFHLDIMDASFVPNLTFGPDTVNAIKQSTMVPLDIHLLMEHPRVIIRSLDIKEHDIVSIHSECKESVMENAAFIKQKNARFGLALNPDTSIDEVRKYLPYVDVILLMLIVPGFSGTPMIRGMMDKVGETREYLDEHGYKDIEIEVDGSVSAERAKYMKALGASIFVGGTAGIFKKDIPFSKTISDFYNSIK
jgi:ribulose-phosphate 3-epimerase